MLLFRKPNDRFFVKNAALGKTFTKYLQNSKRKEKQKTVTEISNNKVNKSFKNTFEGVLFSKVTCF